MALSAKNGIKKQLNKNQTVKCICQYFYTEDSVTKEKEIQMQKMEKW